jgi:hypothetical protein
VDSIPGISCNRKNKRREANSCSQRACRELTRYGARELVRDSAQGLAVEDRLGLGLCSEASS